jgi:threonine dehydratase
MVACAGLDSKVTLPVSYDDVIAALPHVHGLLKPTALFEWPGLSKLLGCKFHLKHENHQPVGAFKIRGGINFVSTHRDELRESGIIGVSTGNHGQSLAYAARHFSVPCTIVVPEKANPDKCESIRNLGAELIEHGRDFDEAKQHIEQLRESHGGRYVHSANEPLLIAGVGTMAWEIFEQLPDPDVILVPIGLGSGVCGTCIVAKHRYPQAKVIGVQSEVAPAVANSWRTNTTVTTESANTWGEGFATRAPAEMTMEIMQALMDDVILVSEDELRQAAYWILKHTHNLAEGAGAGALAAAFKEQQRFAGKKVVGILSGGNLDLAELPRILDTGFSCSP